MGDPVGRSRWRYHFRITWLGSAVVASGVGTTGEFHDRLRVSQDPTLQARARDHQAHFDVPPQLVAGKRPADLFALLVEGQNLTPAFGYNLLIYHKNDAIESISCSVLNQPGHLIQTGV
jgi:hypothetical protein